MFKKKLFILFGVILMVGLLIVIAGCTPTELQALQGTLQNVDSVSGNVTVQMKDGSTRIFNFNDVKLDTIQQALGGASLEIGDQVTVKADNNGDVAEVKAYNAEIDGVIKEIVNSNVTITEDNQTDITLQVTPDTKITIEGQGAAAFTNLKAGQKVEARYNVTTSQALRINVETDQAPGAVKGTIKSIDDGNKTVTITSNQQADIILTINSQTVIRIEDHGTAALSDLKPGQQITARYDTSSMNALKINVNTHQDDQGQNKKENNQHQSGNNNDNSQDD